LIHFAMASFEQGVANPLGEPLWFAKATAAALRALAVKTADKPA